MNPFPRVLCGPRGKSEKRRGIAGERQKKKKSIWSDTSTLGFVKGNRQVKRRCEVVGKGRGEHAGVSHRSSRLLGVLRGKRPERNVQMTLPQARSQSSQIETPPKDVFVKNRIDQTVFIFVYLFLFPMHERTGDAVRSSLPASA